MAAPSTGGVLTMATQVLTVNAGSSSVRLAVAELGVGDGPPRVVARVRHDRDGVDETDALEAFVADQQIAPVVVAHRVVHGGPRHLATTVFDEDVAAEVSRMNPLAPLHNPPALAWLARCRRRWPALAQLAVFDTGFFAGLPAVASTYALPADLSARWGLRRLGFHGLAHRSLWRAFVRNRPGGAQRVVSFQLGSGCSAAALLDGRPVDVSMGFTPLEGLVMATRSGDLDPGIVLHLLEQEKLTGAQLATILEERSGLAGVSGTDGDLRSLLASQDERARLAVDLYCYRARKYLGAYMAALGGCDAVLLGGGVAEKAPVVRQQILAGLDRLGLTLDSALNARTGQEGRISAGSSSIEAWVLPTDEEAEMAEETRTWLGSSRPR
jgi:acetate kinase